MTTATATPQVIPEIGSFVLDTKKDQVFQVTKRRKGDAGIGLLDENGGLHPLADCFSDPGIPPIATPSEEVFLAECQDLVDRLKPTPFSLRLYHHFSDGFKIPQYASLKPGFWRSLTPEQQQTILHLKKLSENPPKIYTASYFESGNHHSKIISISRSIPKGEVVDGSIPWLAPPEDLHHDWEAWKKQSKEAKTKFPSEKHIADYTSRYADHVMPSLPRLEAYLNNLTEPETWCCWEKKGSFCHRNLLMAMIESDYPAVAGGKDIKKLSEVSP